MKKLYFECYAGISGDMLVAALLDLGADEQLLIRTLNSLPLEGFKVQINRVKKAGIAAVDFHVVLDVEHENYDHDMEYLHGHHHDNEPEQKHAHGYHAHHVHRGLKEIYSIIDKGGLTANANKIAHRIFTVLAEAEAEAHGVTIDEVHFHEVGAVDSIVDVVAVAVCLDNLGMEHIIVPLLCEGRGTVRCQHGILPIPVPAVANIISRYHLKVNFMNVDGEFITPTGAAIVAAVATEFALPSQFCILRVGVGAGKREYEIPSMVRVMLIEEEDKENREDEGEAIYKLESNIDDCTGENLGYTMERLLEAGARDVHYIPVYMKKNRPAYQINVICKEADIKRLEQIIFEETSTIGIRRIKVERSILKRTLDKYQTSLGEVLVKVCEISRGKRYYPEYDSLIRICKERGKSYQEVYRQVLAELPQE